MPFKDITTSTPIAKTQLDGAQSREPAAKPPAAPKPAATVPPAPSSAKSAPAVKLPSATPKVTLAEAKQLAEDGHSEMRYPLSGKYLLTTDAASTDSSDVAHAKLTKANQTLDRMNRQIGKYEQAEKAARAAGDYFLADKLATLRQDLEHERNTLQKSATDYGAVANKQHAGLPAITGAQAPANAAATAKKPTAAEKDLVRKELGDRVTSLHSRYGALAVRVEGLRKLGGAAYAKELAAIKVEAKALEAEKKSLYVDIAKQKSAGNLDAKGAAALDTQLVALVGATEHAHAKATSQDLDLLH